MNYFEIFNISKEIQDITIEIRKNYGIKLPDSSIIYTTALVNGATLVSSDKQLSKIVDLDVLNLKRFCE